MALHPTNEDSQGSQEIYRGRRYVVSRVWTEEGVSRILKQARLGALAPTSAAMLRHEFELLRELEDAGVAGVVRPLGLETMAETVALVLEDAGPRDLREWLKRNPVDPDTFLELALQLATILAEIHGRNIIHRDLNPSNIILAGREHRVTVIDFDIATKVAGLSHAANLLGELELTLPYISPEQTGRMDRLVDHRADLYSLGATFYEMLTGLPPFTSPDPVELVHAHLARPPLPPVHANSKVPEVLSDLVLKLLAKMPEDRYQSAESLLADLQELQKRKRVSGKLEPFELGRLDLARQLPLPEHLYGREHEQAKLGAALERVQHGPSECLLVVGVAGIGKSSLVHTLRQRLGRAGWFLSGKFDQLQRNVPYAPLVDAFHGLIRELLNEPANLRDLWRRRLLDAVGAHGSVILEVLPQLEQLIGKQPPVPVLGASEAETRFHLTFQSFIRTIASPEAPLVLFLDDLQWADPASLSLFQHLAVDPESQHVLLVGASRPEAIEPEHPVARTLAALREGRAALRIIGLAPLDLEALTDLCHDTLRREPAQVQPLAELVLRKTAGNPLFVTQFLRYLHQSGLLHFDVERGLWNWDLARMEQVSVTENVLELMLLTIRRLPERTQSLLTVAACLGNRVDLQLLATLMRMSVGETAAALWSSIQEGLLVPENKGSLPPCSDGQAPTEHLEHTAIYRFAHDRIQQAAYSLLPERHKKRLHLEAGRLLRNTCEHTLDERLFEVADQLNLGAELVTNAEERLELARLNLQAGRKAKTSSAFRSALGYLTRGIGFLPPDAWRSHYELTFRLHREATECAYITDAQELSEKLITSALTQARSRLEKADLYTLWLLACVMRRAFPEALQCGREGLRLLGIELPGETDLPQAFTAELAAVKENLRGRSFEELLEAPQMKDPEQLACMRLLSELITVSFFVDPTLFAFINIRVINLTLKHGNTLYAASSYALYGMRLGLRLGDYASGHAFGRLGVELSLRYDDPRQRSRTLIAFAVSVNHWRAPLRTDLPLSRQAFAAGLASGDLQFADYAVSITAYILFAMGTSFSLMLSELESGLTFFRKRSVHRMVDSLLALRQAIRCLQDRARERTRFEDDEFNEATFLASNRNLFATITLYRILRLQVSYLLGDYEYAREMSREAAAHLDSISGWFFVAEHNFYTSLLLAACCAKATPEEQSHLLAEIAANQHQLGIWAENCPENFRHKYELVSAEVARLEGRHVEAMRLYDSAIEGAHREEFLQDEALANELAGRYFRTAGGKRLAHVYLRGAIEGYARWGAQAKVSALEEEFPGLEPTESVDWKTPDLTPAGGAVGGSALDMLSILKAADTLVSEVVLDRLLDKLMTVCLEAAGAQRGALVLNEKDTLMVRALGAVSEPVALGSTPLRKSSQVPVTLIEHACDSGEALVLANAAWQGAFVSDPYVAQHAVKSALAVPIQRPPKTIGALYLENNLATRAFTPERVRVLRLLSSQIAIALENSQLFERLRIEVDERRRAEQAVRFLAEWSLILAESLDFETTLAKVTRSVVPYLADWCAVDVIEKDGRLRVVTVAHVDPAKEVLLRTLMEEYPHNWNTPESLVRVLRTGRPLLFSELDDALLRRNNPYREERFFDILHAVSVRSGMIVPLTARGKTLGAIMFASATAGRRFTETELDLAQELARRAAVSIDNARLYGESQDAIQLRDDFLSVAAHELYTPITSLRLSVQGLLRRAGSELPEPLTRGIRSAEAQTRRLSKLIEELLDVTRIQTGHIHLHLERVELAEVIQDVVERMGESITRANSSLSLHLKTGVVGRWDRLRLEQVTTNLLSNALKFGAGKPIDIALDREGDTARLRVSDQGIGIAPDRLPHVFERFERAVSVEHYGGLGLGLHIVREIVAALGGTVRADSKPDVGTTLTVELPCSGPPSIAPEHHAAKDRASASSP
ncbi:AAA family ATPase [Archangium lansingense]|uniref:AAA family ATPase n=1 Tax=Archangium lansingense TaxID=2995310 RepID=UPI003B811124